MAKTFKTPGVYVAEIPTSPSSFAEVSTTIPIFVGYTEKAEFNGENLLNKPVKISNLADFEQRFGHDFKSTFNITKVPKNFILNQDALKSTIEVNDSDGSPVKWQVWTDVNQAFYLYRSLRLFYANGGGSCYILSVGKFGNQDLVPRINDFTGTENIKPFEILQKITEPALLVIPDAMIFGAAAYEGIYQMMLQNCAKSGNRFAILDLRKIEYTYLVNQTADEFRQFIGTSNLAYGAAYLPWLQTTLTNRNDIEIAQLNFGEESLGSFLPEPLAKKAILTHTKDKAQLKNELIQVSLTYRKVLDMILHQFNQLPSSGAVAGVYVKTDLSRGVWKAPANLNLNLVEAPLVLINDAQQEPLNIDNQTGKSINAIRAFKGKGVLVWGARTLAGNTNEWRYISVRRTVSMITQTVKNGCQEYAFEINSEKIWTVVTMRIANYFTSLWKLGALVGNTTKEAFFVHVGLGKTMTANDVLAGRMIVEFGVAPVRPAEFIVVRFEIKMVES